MKFGKQYAKVVTLSPPEWAPFWISYKALKKRVKELTDSNGQPPAHKAGESSTNTEPTVEDLAQSAGEVAFFRTIRAEIQKASEFYLGVEQQMSARKRRIRLGITYLKQPTTVLEDDAWIKMRRACISLYKDLLLLENFAVMNYCACSKALKKHDKTVGLDTRARFMRNVVSQQPFTHYPRLLEMLQEMEQTFTEIDALQGESARPLEDEERLFLEAIRGLNQEASSMQREEKADLAGSPASDPEHSSDDHCAGNKESTSGVNKSNNSQPSQLPNAAAPPAAGSAASTTTTATTINGKQKQEIVGEEEKRTSAGANGGEEGEGQAGDGDSANKRRKI